MSFSGMVKEELSRQISTARHCRIAEIAALLSACGKMTAAGILRFQTENDAVVRKYFTLLQKTFNIETEIAIRESRQMKKGNVYYVEIADPGQVETVLQGTKLSVNEGDGETLYTENALLTQQSCCKRAFIRGAFLASGSISDPEKGYILKSLLRMREKLRICKRSSVVFRSMRRSCCVRSHMWSM